MRQRLRYATLLSSTLVLGFTVRFAALGLPPAVSKYGGSALWAMAIFWMLALAAPRSGLSFRTAASFLLAFGIEFFKLVRTPVLDAFRLTLAGKLVLGRFFSVRDLLAYTVAILVAAAIDRAAFRAKESARR